MIQTVKRISVFFPWIGLLLILAGAIVTYVTQRFETTSNLLFGFGVLSLLLFAILQPDQIRAWASGRQARYGTSTLLSILFFAAIAVLAYYLVYQNPDWRYDTTEAGEFTPPAETVELLENMPEPVHVIGFYTIQQTVQKEQAESLLENLKAIDNDLTYEFEDPEVNPLLAQEYDLNFAGTLVFVKGTGEERVFSKSNSLTDRDIYSALVEIANPVDKKLYVLTGHGEPGIADFEPMGLATSVGLLEDSGFTVEELNLNVAGAVPDDATAVAVLDPAVPLQQVEVDALRDYLRNGGSAFIARDVIDSEQKARANEDGLHLVLLDEWGIAVRNDVIVEQVFAQAGSGLDIAFLAASYGSSPVTTDLGQYGTVFNVVRSVRTQMVDGVTQTELVRTSEESWGETDLAALSAGMVQPNEAEDTLGPLAVGVSAENLSTGGRLVVFGDADFFKNEMIFQLGNSFLFTNALNWLANDEVSINLTPRETIQRQLVIPQEQLGLMQVTGLCLGPALMAVLGAFIWYSRRQRS